MLDLLRLPDIRVEQTVDLADVGEQDEQLEHVAVDLELHAGEVVDHVAVALGHDPRGTDAAIHRVQFDRRMLLTESVHMLEDPLRRHRLSHAPIMREIAGAGTYPGRSGTATPSEDGAARPNVHDQNLTSTDERMQR